MEIEALSLEELRAEYYRMFAHGKWVAGQRNNYALRLLEKEEENERLKMYLAEARAFKNKM